MLESKQLLCLFDAQIAIAALKMWFQALRESLNSWRSFIVRIKTRLKIGTISSMHCLVSLFYYYLPLSLHVFCTFLKSLLYLTLIVSSVWFGGLIIVILL